MSHIEDHLAAIKLGELRRAHGLVHFVETGCLVGESLAYAVSVGFRSLFSCDLVLDAVREASALVPRAHVLHCESREFLQRVLPSLTDRGVCFWLDAHASGAHWPEANVETPENHFPLMDELRLIRAWGCSQSVILVDDINHHFNIDAAAIAEEFAATHSARYAESPEGVLVLEPHVG